MRNEALLIRYWLRHYGSFCDRLIIYDDNSDDGSVELAREAGAEIRQCPWSGLDDMQAVSLASEQYKEARGQADWAIWVDADEFVYYPDISRRLTELRFQGITLPVVEGYSMFADALPRGEGQIYDEIADGLLDDRYSKPVVINPMLDIIWGPGRHEFAADLASRDDFTESPLKLLHYRWFGTDEYLRRNARNLSRISPTNLAMGLGIEVTSPNYNGHHSLAWYQALSLDAKPCL